MRMTRTEEKTLEIHKDKGDPQATPLTKYTSTKRHATTTTKRRTSPAALYRVHYITLPRAFVCDLHAGTYGFAVPL